MTIYTSQAIVGYNANPPSDDGLEEGQNEITWAGIKSKLTDPIKTLSEGINTAVVAFAATAEALMPAGAILPYAGASAPTGFLLCYGQAVSRTTYAALFTALGTVYGSGDGSTTFNVPDLRGRVPAGKDDMGGTSANRLTDQSGGLNGDTLGDTGGAETNTISQANLPSYNLSASLAVTGTITVNAGGNGAFRIEKSNAAVSPGSTNGARVDDAAPVATHSLTAAGNISSGGSGTAIGNVQPTIILNYIIKT